MAKIFSRNVLTSAALLVGLLPGAAGAFTLLGTDQVTKPADPDYVHVRTVFDCLAPDTLLVAVGLDTTLADSTTGLANTIAGYPCAPWAEGGPERIYRLEVASELELHAAVTPADPNDDFDLFLLDDCDSESCLVGVNIEFTAVLAAGTYFLVVDGASVGGPNEGVFALDLVARPVGLPEEICAPDGAVAVACTDSVIALPDQNLFGRPDLIRAYDCNTVLKTAGEMWYVVAVGPERELVVQVVADAESVLDPCLWVFGGCGPDALCEGFADAGIAGAGESVTLDNPGPGTRTWYIGVDAPRPPAEAADGAFEIRFQCQSTVPNEATSFGGVKALYR